MGDVVRITEAHRSRRPARRDGEVFGPGRVLLFTGIRIERRVEPEDAATPEPRPTSPRRRRRRS